jgi:hypothetical protein
LTLRRYSTGLVFCCMVPATALRAAEPVFVRGDATGDGIVDLADPLLVLRHRFCGGPEPACADAADANADGELDLSDVVATLSFLFREGASPPQPFPGSGVDDAPEELPVDALRSIVAEEGVIITKPTCGSGIASPLLVQGLVRRLRPGEELRILIRDPLGQWFVQRNPRVRFPRRTSPDGRWRVRAACVGERRDRGEEFVICAVITTSSLRCGQILQSCPSGPNDTCTVARVRRWRECPPCSAL